MQEAVHISQASNPPPPTWAAVGATTLPSSNSCPESRSQRGPLPPTSWAIPTFKTSPDLSTTHKGTSRSGHSNRPTVKEQKVCRTNTICSQSRVVNYHRHHTSDFKRDINCKIPRQTIQRDNIGRNISLYNKINSNISVSYIVLIPYDLCYDVVHL